ncbi:MAG: hypothetical protein M5U23_01075 [Acidimicrobiia bacterium]|nr:hypothetical protein [Acidimicrobiia bacterium]
MKGRPILGVVAGFLFGLLLGPTLWLWGVIELASPLMWILPIVGIVLGLLMAAWAPFGMDSTDEPADEPAVDTAPPARSDALSETAPEAPPTSGPDSKDESSS